MTTLYVAPDGDDGNSGSESDPFGTLGRAVGALNGLSDAAGSTLVVRGGSYQVNTDGKLRIAASGTADEPVRIEAASGETPVVDLSGAGNGTWGGGVRIDSVSHLALRGLEFHGSSGFGVSVAGACQDVLVEDCVTRDNGNTGLYFYLSSADAADIVARNCESYGNYHGDSHADGFAVGQDDAGGAVTFVGCDAHHNEDDGFDFFYGDGEAVYGSLAWENGLDPSGNRIHGSGGGNGFKMGGGDNSGPNHLYTSTAFRNDVHGVIDNENVGDCRFYNLTLWNNGSDNISCWGSGNHEIRNCISHQGGVNFADAHDHQHNSWNLGIDDPGFRSTDPDEANFLHLAAGSPCVDAGMDVGLDYTGAAPDLGAYQAESTDETTESDHGLYYYDGTAWQPVGLQYHDGEQFV